MRWQRTWPFKGILRSPSSVIVVIIMMSTLCVVGVLVPQNSGDTKTPSTASRGEWDVVAILALDRIFRSQAFIVITGLLAILLVVSLLEQGRRLRVALKSTPARTDFEQARYQLTFERPVAGDAVVPRQTTIIRSRGRIGLAGSFLLHLALVLVIAGGTLRALFGIHAVVDLVEGEELPSTREQWGERWPGPLAGSLEIDPPATLKDLTFSFHPSGGLSDLEAVLSIAERDGPRERDLALNRDLRVGRTRIFLSPQFGATALIEWGADTPMPKREAVLLRPIQNERYEGMAQGRHGTLVHLRAELHSDRSRPEVLEVRAMKSSALMLGDTIRIGESVRIPGEGDLTLLGLPFWVQVRADRDPGLSLIFAGFALGIIGVTILFTVITLDTCIEVTPAGDTERVYIALRARRFEALFEDSFKRLVADQGGAI